LKNRGLLAILIAFIAGLIAIGCGGNGSDNGGGTAGNTGTLKVMLADAGDPTITALNLTINKVEANVDGQWKVVSDQTQTFDLLALAKTDTEIGSADLPVGTYDQIRFFPTSATVTDSTGTHDVTIPSGSQTGVKVNIQGGYTVTNKQVTTLLIDFNVQHSLVVTGSGKYILKPVVKGVVKVLSGTVTGTVQDANGVVAGAEVDAYLSSDMSTVVNSTTTRSDGTFKVWALMPGTYTLVISDTPEGGSTETATVTDVAVTADHNTDVGTVTIS